MTDDWFGPVTGIRRVDNVEPWPAA
jgi:hypothetical protein